MQKSFYSLIFLIILFSSCETEREHPHVSFEADVSGTVDSTHIFMFYNYSDENVSSHWDFGDSTFSDERNPSHAFNRKGKFRVKLTVTDQYGASTAMAKDFVVGNYSWGFIRYDALSNMFTGTTYLSLEICPSSFIYKDTVSLPAQFPLESENIDADSTSAVAPVLLDTTCVHYFHEGDSATSNAYALQIFPSLFEPDYYTYHYDVSIPTVQDTVKLRLFFNVSPP